MVAAWVFQRPSEGCHQRAAAPSPAGEASFPATPPMATVQCATPRQTATGGQVPARERTGTVTLPPTARIGGEYARVRSVRDGLFLRTSLKSTLEMSMLSFMSILSPLPFMLFNEERWRYDAVLAGGGGR